MDLTVQARHPAEQSDVAHIHFLEDLCGDLSIG